MKETYPAYQYSEISSIQYPACSSSTVRRGKPDPSVQLNYFAEKTATCVRSHEPEMIMSGGRNDNAIVNIPRMAVHPPEWSQPTPVIPTTTNTFDRRLLNTAIDWSTQPPRSVENAGSSSNKEAIHSGHFMVSDLKEEDDEQDDQIEKIAPDITKNVENEVIRKRSVGITNSALPDRQLAANNNAGPNSTKISVDELRRRFVEASLTQLFQCMSLAYSAKLTSPKWNNFKGLKIRWAIKIRLNNYIWRAWHMQFVKRNVQQFSPFALETESMHNRPEAVVLEGKYWKRRLSMAAAEYRKVRLFFKNWANKKSLYTLLPNDLSTDIDMGLDLPDDFDMSLLQFEPMLTDDGGMLFGEDFIQTITSGQHQMIFPNAREIAQQAGIADFIQPGLLELQPSVADYVDSSMLADSFQNSSWGTDPAAGNFYSGMHASSSSSSMRNADAGGWQPSPQHQQRLTDNYLSTPPGTSHYNNNNMIQKQVSSNDYAVMPPPYYQQMSQPTGNDNFFARPTQPRNSVRGRDIAMLSNNEPTFEMAMQVDDSGYFAAPSGSFRSRSASGPRQLQQQQQQLYEQQHFNAPQQLPSRSVRFNDEPPQPSVVNDQSFFKPPGGVDIVVNRRHADAATLQHRLSLQDNTPFEELQDSTNERPQRTKSDITEISGYIHQQKAYMASISGGTAANQSSRKHGSDANVRDAAVFKSPVRPPAPALPGPTTPIQHTHGAIYAALLANNNNSAAVRGGPTEAEASGDESLRSRPKRRSKTAQQQTMSQKLSTSALYSPLPVTSTSPPTTAAKTSKVTAVKPAGNSAAISSPKAVKLPALKPSLSTSAEPQLRTLPPPQSTQPISPSSTSSLAIFSTSAASTSSCSTVTTTAMPSAEQLRRTHIKSGFDVLLNLLPSNYKQQQQQQSSSPQNSSAAAAAAAAAAKVSKAAVLHKSADYLKHLKADRKRMQDEEDSLHKRIVQLNEEINYYHTQLPEAGVPTVASRQRGEQLRAMFDVYVRQRTLENHKFYAFGLIMRRLFDSYVECMATVGGNSGSGNANSQDADEFGEIIAQWHEQHCTLPQLRPIVRDSLRQLCTSTSIMSSPDTYAQSVRDKAILLSGAGASGRTSAAGTGRSAENASGNPTTSGTGH